MAAIGIHPTEVKGPFRNARVWVRAGLVIFILVLPWIKIRGHQALLLDIFHRKFSAFGVHFFAQDVPLLFLLLINFVLGIALVTALWGRVWCGWMCPQTVFIEGIFRRIEGWIEGDAETRRKLQARPLDFERTMKKVLKWFLFSLCTLWVTHSILAIFIGSDHLREIMGRPFSENPAALFFIFISNAILLADFGWLREQFCIVACPYGKFQSVLQDQYTVSVTYNISRTDDCVNCSRCVRVCPTGIDIRNGSQLECIACTACADACNDVMKRLKKPRALIGYFSEAQVNRQSQRWMRPRVFFYMGLILLFGSVAIAQMVLRKPYEVMIYKTKGAPFGVVLDSAAGKKITNLFSAELSNKSEDPIQITLQMNEDAEVELIMPNNPLIIEAGKVQSNPFTVEFSPKILELGSADREIQVKVKNLNTHQEWNRSEPVHFVGPF